MRFLFLLLLLTSVSAQYRPIDQPEEWLFERATPAYSTEDHSEQMGTFQPGIKVSVLGHDGSQRFWKVAFTRYGQPDIVSLIAPPNLAESKSEDFAKVAKVIADFPILKKLLESESPWPENPNEMTEYLFDEASGGYQVHSGSKDHPTILEASEPEKQAAAWGIQPLAAKANYSQKGNPSVSIEFWNKGDAFQSTVDPSEANQTMEAAFEQIQAAFPTYRKDPAANAVAITAVRTREKVYLLPNDLRVSLRYNHGEYLLLSIRSISKLDAQIMPESCSFMAIRWMYTLWLTSHRLKRKSPAMTVGARFAIIS